MSVLPRWLVAARGGGARPSEPRQPFVGSLEEFGLPRQLVGRASAVLFVVCGLLAIVSQAMPSALGARSFGVVVTGVIAVTSGVICWYLPWSRWPRWYTHILVPIGFALISAGTLASPAEVLVSNVFYCAVFTLIGLAHRRGAGLVTLPLFIAVYLAPVIAETGSAASAASSALVVGLVCVACAEMVAWIADRLRRSQAALRRAHSAVNEVSLGLSTQEPRDVAEAAAIKLCEVMDATDVHVYRIQGRGEVQCLASVSDGRPDRDAAMSETRGLQPDEELAITTRKPVLMPLPADARRRHDGTVAALPLLAGAEVIGLVQIGMGAVQAVQDDRIDTAVSVCRLIAIAIRDAEALQAEKAQAGRLASLLESSQAVASAASLEDALAIVVRCAGDVLGVTECVAWEYEKDEAAIVARAMWEVSPTGWDRLREATPLVDLPAERRVLESNSVLVERISDPDLDPVSRTVMEIWGEKSCLTVPMRSVDGPVGMLVFYDSERDRDFSEEETALALGLGELAAESIRSARMVNDLRRLSRTDSLTGLANHREIREGLDREYARAQRHGKPFSVAMLDVDGFKLFNDTYGHPVGDSVLREVAKVLQEQTRPCDIVGRYGGDEFLLILPETDISETDALTRRIRGAFSSIPHVTADGDRIPIHASIGVAAYPADARGVTELVAVVDSRLYASKRRGGDSITGARDDELERGLGIGSFGVLESLVAAVDNKDSYTRRHSADVTEHALALADAAGLSEDSRRILGVAGLLHDVGKIGVPDCILRKPGRLTSEEFEIVKGHAALGETIIAALPDLHEIRGAVLSHHERYDGKGYPRGLAGDEIPLFGRILAVADAYSAMTTDRPYRSSLAVEEAIAELRAGAGSQFDPELAELFIWHLGSQDHAATSPRMAALG